MISQVVWAEELQVAPEMTSPALARGFVEHCCNQHGLSYLVGDICLVASELVTNAVVHARTRIRVRIEERLLCLKLTVFDESLDLPLMSLGSQFAQDESGRGLRLVDAFSAAWGTDLAGDEGKSTWALFALRPRSSSVHAGRQY